MEDGKELWSIWQRLVGAFRGVFTRPGWVRFVQWISGTVLCDEQHTITQEVTALGLLEQWRNWERMAEYGAWDERGVERSLMELIERERPCRLGRYHPVAVDDTKEQRASDKVWGVCTFKVTSSRSPKHPKLVRGHNWVIMGGLADAGEDQPRRYLPMGARLYLRESQLPKGETFRTKNELAVELLGQAQAVSAAPLLGIFDGGYAQATVVQPCLAAPDPADPPRQRIEILTRPRCDARLYQPLKPADPTRRRRVGRPRKWGRRLPAPQRHARWKVPWEEGEAWIYGRRRHFRVKSLDCRWAVSGPQTPVRVFVFEVEGYTKPWYIVTSALDLSAAQVVEAYAARFRQEDGIRDHKQRLGMEEVRAWTKAPVLRTFQVQMVAMALLGLLEDKAYQQWGQAWCAAPPWNRHKARASILDLRRLLWRHRAEFSQFLRVLDETQKPLAAAG